MSMLCQIKGMKCLGKGAGMLAVMLALSVQVQAADREAKSPKAEKAQTVSGREIFLREWIPNDPRSHGGDGLGPVFNDSSCVACHNQGGAGGGGSASKNVNIVSATFNQPIHHIVQRRPGVGEMLFRSVLGLNPEPPRQPRELSKEQLEKQRKLLVDEVAKIHPGFRTASSVVIHHFGMDDNYDAWKSRLTGSDMFFGDFGGFQGNQMVAMEAQAMAAADPAFALTEEPHAATAVAVDGFEGRVELEPEDIQRGRHRLHQTKARVRPVVFSGASQHGHFAVSTSQRNATALFGAGLIDAVPEKVLVEAAKKTYKDFPEVSGRVAKLPDGKIGKYGWKAQKATLRDFTVTACAVELGLHVPEHPQSGDPNKPEYKPAGYDLTKEECTALVDYIRDLPAPQMRKANHPVEQKYLEEGKALFASVGCAACHTEDLGEAQSIYSDLLLHDMGAELGDTGSYGVFLPDSPGGDDGSPVPPITELTQPVGGNPGVLERLAQKPGEEEKNIVGATLLEWRTPPLWGVRDSAPYLHDGRAKTLEEAIAMHGGEAQKSATHFFALKPEDQRKVVFFLKSLEAPTETVAER